MRDLQQVLCIVPNRHKLMAAAANGLYMLDLAMPVLARRGPGVMLSPLASQ